jgi:hypothetical protein
MMMRREEKAEAQLQTEMHLFLPKSQQDCSWQKWVGKNELENC